MDLQSIVTVELRFAIILIYAVGARGSRCRVDTQPRAAYGGSQSLKSENSNDARRRQQAWSSSSSLFETSVAHEGGKQQDDRRRRLESVATAC